MSKADKIMVWVNTICFVACAVMVAIMFAAGLYFVAALNFFAAMLNVFSVVSILKGQSS